jgi:tetratricopeptide (TPR) repeat protein
MFARVIARATATPSDGLDAWRAAEGLPDVGACATLVAVPGLAVPPAQQAQVGTMSAELHALQLSHMTSSVAPLPRAADLVRRLEQIGYQPLLVDALTFEGQLAIDAADYASAEDLLRRAIRTSEDAHYDSGRARAATVLAIALIDVGRLDEAKDMLDTAEAANTRAGADPDIALDLMSVRAKLADAQGDYARAAELLRGRVDEERRRHGEASVLLAQAWFALGNEYVHAQDDAKSAGALAEATKIFTRYGVSASNPEQLGIEAMQALQAGDFERAIDRAERTVAQGRAQHYPIAALAVLEGTRGAVYEVAGQPRPALAAYKIADALFQQVPIAERDLDGWGQALIGIGGKELDLGDAAAAIAPNRQAIAALTKLGASGDDDRLIAEMQLGHALVAVGRMREARDVLEPNLRALRDATPRRAQRIGSASFFLAQALWDDGDAHDRERARALADDAAREMTAALADAADRPVMVTLRATMKLRLRELETWRARHP